MSSARIAMSRASVPFAQPTAKRVRDRCATSLSSVLTAAPKMKVWSSTTRIMAVTTSSRIVACWARRSKSGTAIECRNLLGFHAERQGDLAPHLRRLIDAENELERFSARAAVRVRLRLAAQHLPHVAVISLVPVPVDVRRVRARDVNELVVVVILGEGPVLGLVDGGAADFHRALLPEDRDRPLEVPRVGEHRHFDRAERAVPELQDRDAGVLGLNAP